MFNPNWIRWLRASLINVFDTYNRTDLTIPVISGSVQGKLPFYLGFGDRKDILNQPYWLELRRSEEKYLQYSPTCFDIMIDIGVLSFGTIDDADIYTKDLVDGIAVSMHNDFAVSKYGSRLGDDQSYITCMNLVTESESNVRLFNLGKSDDGLSNITLIEASYRGRFES